MRPVRVTRRAGSAARRKPSAARYRISSPSVRATNLAQVADELYALAPTEFRTARDERARQARAAGDADLAEAIKKLRRPTVSAWLVNLLVREDPGQVRELLELGESLREAQQALAADRLRDLSVQRRQLVGALTEEAQRLAADASQSLSAQVEREVQDTLEASLADSGIADAVGSGRLTRALSYAGLGEGVGVDDAVAVWAAPAELQVAPSRDRGPGRQAAPAKQETRQRRATSRPAREVAAGRGRRTVEEAKRDRREAEAAEQERRQAEAAERERRRAEEAERDRREAGEDAREAQDVLDAAEREVTSAHDRHQALQRRIEDLERQLDQLQTESAQDLRVLRQAQRRRDVAARALDGALRRLARAQAKADAIGGGAPSER